MTYAVRQGVPYLVAPCFVGKVNFSFQIQWNANGDAIHGLNVVLKNKQPEKEKHVHGLKIGQINKLQVKTEGTWTHLAYPRSRWLTSQFCTTKMSRDRH